MSDETKHCTNCERDIPSTNYQIHSVHCIRNIQLCPLCNEPVARINFEEHNKEFHTAVTCTECLDMIENSELNQHKNEICRKRKISCQHCELELKADEIPEHEDYCGARTECCSECGKFVMIKFQKMHLDSNHKLINIDECDENSDSDDSDYNNPYNFRENTFENRHARNDMYHLNRPVRITNRSRHSSLNEYFQDMDLDSQMATNRTNGVRNCHSDVSGAYNRLSRENIRDSEEQTMIPCEFCEFPVPVDELILHQTGCRPDLFSQDQKNNSSSESFTPSLTNLVESISDDSDDFNAQGFDVQNEVFIPCQVCNEQFTLENIDEHQLACYSNRELWNSEF